MHVGRGARYKHRLANQLLQANVFFTLALLRSLHSRPEPCVRDSAPRKFFVGRGARYKDMHVEGGEVQGERGTDKNLLLSHSGNIKVASEAAT